jgi:hypothetical protein
MIGGPLTFWPVVMRLVELGGEPGRVGGLVGACVLLLLLASSTRRQRWPARPG